VNKKGDLEQQIREGLRRAAVLIPVVSETIESRKWCRDEMGWFSTEANMDRVVVKRMYPVYLPFNDPGKLPRWTKQEEIYRFYLDPARLELIAQQDLDAHRPYWDSLYGWMSQLAQGIVAAHTAWLNFNAMLTPTKGAPAGKI
jgi:hypothetical protein